MRLLYFAAIRERVGKSEETIALPASVTTAGQLVDWLAARDDAHAAAFANRTRLRLAVNQEQADFDNPVAASDEVAFFPPMTGG